MCDSIYDIREIWEMAESTAITLGQNDEKLIQEVKGI